MLLCENNGMHVLWPQHTYIRFVSSEGEADRRLRRRGCTLWVQSLSGLQCAPARHASYYYALLADAVEYVCLYERVCMSQELFVCGVYILVFT